MMRAVSSIIGSTVNAEDGDIGTIKNSYFDDNVWAIRYLVVDTGGWLTGRKVLISPYSVTQPLGDKGLINVALTREKIRMSPDIDTHKPVSRRQESEFLGYYSYPFYWTGVSMWPMGGYPGAYTMIPPPSPPLDEDEDASKRTRAMATKSDDQHLRSTEHVSGYHLQASDDSIGHIEDFIFDEESWAIRYLVIDTRNWWPGGKHVLVAPHWIDHISWAEKKVFTSLSRESVKAAPAYEGSAAINRDYESRLHTAHDRKGYWDFPEQYSIGRAAPDQPPLAHVIDRPHDGKHPL
jgi:uncharacterized protein YrrD